MSRMSIAVLPKEESLLAKTAIVLVLAMLSQAAGDVFLSKEMKAIASSAVSPFEMALLALLSPNIWLGTALLLIFFILFAVALSWADLSFVLPASAFGYVMNVACGYYFLGETVSRTRWAGATIISIGVVLVSRSGVRTVEAPGGQDVLEVIGRP
jgi:uncharacterized membrane protein